MDNPIDHAEFRAWLAAKEPDAVVGMRQHAEACPLAAYLLDGTARYVQINGTIGIWEHIAAPSTHTDLSPWQHVFVNRVDAVHNGFPGTAPITAAEALAILDAIPEDTR